MQKTALDKTQHLFMIKTLHKMGIEETYLSIANIMLNIEKMKEFPLRLEARQDSLLSPLLFNIVLKVLATSEK